MDNLRYYFFEGKVETATTTIHGWQELTAKQIEQYSTGDYDVAFVNDKWDLVLHVEPIFDLQQYKLDKIKELSYLALSVGNRVAPNYKLDNCILSKEMELNGETPIYENWRNVMNEYKNKRTEIRNEFYRLKYIVENANSQTEIDSLFTINIFIL